MISSGFCRRELIYRAAEGRCHVFDAAQLFAVPHAFHWAYQGFTDQTDRYKEALASRNIGV